MFPSQFLFSKAWALLSMCASLLLRHPRPFNSWSWSTILPICLCRCLLILSTQSCLLRTCLSLSCATSSSLRQWTSFIGLLNFAGRTLIYGRVCIKRFERLVYLGYLLHPYDTDGSISIRPSLQPDFHWWLAHLPNARRPIHPGPFVRVIFTDASSTGWGAVSDIASTRGLRSARERDMHINELELRAALFGLRCLAQDLQNCSVLLLIDNTTAVAYINKMGGIRYSHLNAIARNIWQWCETRRIYLHSFLRKCSR